MRPSLIVDYERIARLKSLTIPPSHFARPSKVIVGGPSMSGKSTIVRYIIDHNLITPPPKQVYWISESRVPDKNRNYTYVHSSVPEDDEFFEHLYDACVVIDDCQVAASDSDAISKLFRRVSHHNRLIVFLIVQNINFAGRRALDSRRNCNYYILFRNPADRDQYNHFQSKFGLSAKKKKGVTLNQIIRFATRGNPQHCLIIDCMLKVPSLLLFRLDPRRRNPSTTTIDNHHYRALSQCMESIRLNFPELTAFCLLPRHTTRELSRHLSSATFQAFTTILTNAAAVLHYNLKVISRTDIQRVARYKSIFTALTHATDLQHQRAVLYDNFNYVYKFLKFALRHLLPIAVAGEQQTRAIATEGTRQIRNLQLTHKWLLAVVFLPKDVCFQHIRSHGRAQYLRGFREIAHNLLAGWFQLDAAHTQRLVEPHKPTLEVLAQFDKPLSLTRFIELVHEAYEPIKFACEIVINEKGRQLLQYNFYDNGADDDDDDEEEAERIDD